MTYKLRAALGPDALILANSAGALSDPALNGITIEMESCLVMEACADALLGQHAVAQSPATSIMWLTHSEVWRTKTQVALLVVAEHCLTPLLLPCVMQAMPPAEQCKRVQQLRNAMGPWIQAGTDFFDGSHVICNF